ncbi:MAG TPA: sodium:solute symporter [Planctomycetaceae bacterium]|nr:sodium:solute symporter [Planctomycetaceae bacterium]
MLRILLLVAFLYTAFLTLPAHAEVDWQSLPDLPDPLGVAGPFIGVHNDAMIVAGGANFARPVWDNPKRWHDAIHVLVKTPNGPTWKSGGKLPRKTAYGASVSTPDGVLCIGGNDAESTFQSVFMLRWNTATQAIESVDMPDLPHPLAYAQAAISGKSVYLAGGQTANGIESATNHLYKLDLADKRATWQRLDDIPGPKRAFNLTIAQHNGFDDCIYVISGRGPENDTIKFLTDVWEFNLRTKQFRQRADVPRCVMAGTAVPVGQSHLWVLSGDHGALYDQTELLKDNHPGFPRDMLAYHTITDTWATVASTPANQVTTTAVWWNDAIVIASGELRPRVRTAAVWLVSPKPLIRSFGMLNYAVLFGYLLAMVGVGIYFAWKNKSTDDYFRGGKQIPWWAAGCSIFATMLSSLTFTGIPSKAFAQDWVYSVGNLMIPAVAIVAIFVALPFYRRLDVTSAYEYLELRFSATVRRFGSLSFTFFHIFRMGVVMSLTGYAIAVATPLTPTQSVLLMGVLSIIYCTLGGIEAVIWTDTLQTFVLLGGAIFALAMLITGTEGGWSGAVEAAVEHDKFRIAQFHTDATSAQLALWVVVIGAIGQNLSSYTADQAVVQRYMTTATEELAARSITTNAVMTIPATMLFFGIGTALFAYYRSHPERLDPTITTDQIFPYFIASQVPAGIAGLIVAGIFAAAQSTVSTSMNSTATTLVTDIARPLGWCPNERGYLVTAQVVTLIVGILGTGLGLVFVDPNIRSLFDAFIKVIGLFMGVLGGLFILGVGTKRTTATGAICGAAIGSITMIYLWQFTPLNGYLYTACGITACFASGYAASLVTGPQTKDLTGLTLLK